MQRFKIKYFFLSVFCWFISATTFAQLTTSTAMSPTQLVQNVLLGAGVTATNITYTGASSAIGSFNGTNSNIGFAAGVLMTSGIVSNAIGPNNLTGVSAVNSVNGDPDLNQIMSPTTSYDACIIEFDFVATSDTLQFRYVFGSDEYMEYVGTTPGGINDGFGFFISGPGISGPFANNAQNIAIIPGTSLPVTMFNLNLNTNGQYYVDNGNNGMNNTPGGPTIQYDGFTKPLTAIALLQCGKTYHIKLAIADGGDDIIDSGVFLEAGSFTIPNNNLVVVPSATVIGQPGQVDTVMYEGCGSVQIDLTRSGCNLANPDTMNFTISGTATNGTDYSFLQNNVIFPANATSASFIINSLPDAIAEGSETVIITFPGGKTITIIIVDSPPLLVNLPSDTTIYCNFQNFKLNASVTGGVAIGGYTYTWTNANSNSSSAIVNPIATTTYYLTVTDTCGNTATDSITITISPYVPMQLTLNNDTSICEGQMVLLNAMVSNGAPGYIYTWSPNISTTNSASVRPSVSTTYILTVKDVCGNKITDTVHVTVIGNNASFSYDFISNQQAQFTNLSSGNSANNYWDFGDSSIDSTSTLVDPSHTYTTTGTYTIMLVTTNSLGCSDTAYQTITIYPDFFFYYPNAFSPNGNGSNDIYKGYGVGIKTYHMQIFNRWGERIFETNDINSGWDGMYKGKRAESAVYVVRFDVGGFKDDAKEIISHVTLIR